MREAPAPDAPLDRAGIAMLATLAVLVAARALLAVTHDMWGWALNLQRFLAPALAWGTWMAAAATLAPPVARVLAGPAARAGDGLARGTPALRLVLGAAAALLVAVMPDVVRFVGDFLLRQGTVEIADKPSVLFPQALPLDVLLHYHVPTWLSERGILSPNAAARVLGLVEAALLALVGARLARVLQLRGAPALAAALVLTAGGYLGMYTGFGKAFAEMTLLVAWAGTAALDSVRTGRGLLEVGIAVAIAATLHRSGLALAPMAALAWVLWARAHGAGRWRRPVTWLALAIPLASLAVMVPRIAAIVRRWDSAHFRPGGAGGARLASLAFTPERMADVANLLLMLSPALLVALVALPAVLRAPRSAGDAPVGPRGADRTPADRTRGREALVLLALAIPFLAVMPVLHPAQGMFRDWDDFAATGAAVSLGAAWTLGRALAARPRWLAVPVAMLCLVASVQWLGVHRDLGRGLARVRAFVTEPPERTPAERGTTWDYLGIRYFRLGQEADRDGHLDEAHRHFTIAEEAWRRAADTSPSPRILQEWALAATMKGDLDQAQRVYRRFLAVSPDNVLGWLGYATVSINKGDFPEARRGARGLLRLRPGEETALDLIVQADTLEARARRRAAAQSAPSTLR